jgi:hypothetical protein
VTREDWLLFCKVVGAIVTVVAVAFGLYFAAVSFAEQQGNNLIVRPDPNAPPPLVIPQLPGIVAKLRGAKDLCEGRAQQAKDTLRQWRPRAAQPRLTEGQTAYTNARSAIGSCISFLQTGVTTRFRDGQDSLIEAHIQKADAAMKTFLVWANNIKPRQIRPGELGDDDHSNAILSLWSDWLKAVRAADQKARDDLRDDLEKCRLKEWKDLDK